MPPRTTKPRRRLIVVGGGPKGLAIAAKAFALRETGKDAPDVTVLEAQEVGANWTGVGGYTDGLLPMGTPPEKDVGFPYESHFGEDVTAVMMRRFSWMAYLISKLGHNYGKWVIKGRPFPTHEEYGHYLQWVGRQLAEPIVERAAVTQIARSGKQWSVRVGNRRKPLVGDGLVITGPGGARQMPGAEDPHQRVSDGRNFWRQQHLSDLRDEARRVRARESSLDYGIVGSGETAASIALWLVRNIRTPAPSQVVIMNGQGTLFSRGEGFYESHVAMAPDEVGWVELPMRVRREIIGRTDKGVLSPDALAEIGASERVQHSLLRVERVSFQNGRPVVHGGGTSMVFDRLVLAHGFDPMWFADLISDGALREQLRSAGIEGRIWRDLSIRGITPRLHVPMLSAISQGPGFTGLSCLDTLSDRILAAYSD